MSTSDSVPPESVGSKSLKATWQSLRPPAMGPPPSVRSPASTQVIAPPAPPPPPAPPVGRAPPGYSTVHESHNSPSPPPPASVRPSMLPPPASLRTTLPSSVQKALVTLDKLKAKLDAVERQRKEPIAIVGMACRFPGGAGSPEAFFRLLLEGVDAVTEIPPGRWTEPADEKGRAARWGAFLAEDVSRFEPSFFGISPREAERLDPQQRLLLELTWEALERACQVPGALVGSQTGVFVGLMATDYMLLSTEAPAETWDVYTVTGSAHCFPAGRIAYTFGFQGPAMVIDTACSSSLVAVHNACQSLRAAECDMAIAGGMNLMLSRAMFEMTARTTALSPDGRCKTFDARADGYVRGEGGGVLVLKRLSDAQRDGDPIVALIRGSAVNQDGRSTGLTTPNVLSQQAMLRQALSSARVAPEEIGFVETHGTGTSLGDPIEVEALRAVLGRPREDGTPCVLGAVKTNIGHLEAAAGVAGIMKAAMALQKGWIPRNLHLRAVNPRISLEGTPFAMPTENRRWERGDRPRIAGVSSFGLSGTNAHVILEEAPVEAVEETPDRRLASYLLPLSAKTPEALAELADATARVLSDRDGDPLYDVVHTAALRRMHHEHRLTVCGRDRAEIASALSSYARDGSGPRVAYGKAGAAARQRIVFVFPGQGSQWIGMGRRLVREEPVFRASMEVCHESIRRHGTFSLLEEIDADEGRSRLGEIDVVQPMIFAIQVSLAALWRSWGIEPDLVVGHSMGEVAAARVAGILSPEDAAKVICRRSRMLCRIVGQGAMAQVELSPAEAREAIAGLEGALAVAVHNGPRSTVLSGDPGALEAVLERLEGRGVYVRRVKVDVASHSPQVDILMEDLAAVLFNLRPRDTKIPMISTVTGEAIRGPELVADYWVKNLREPVQFAQVIQRLLDDRRPLFVEVSPHPVLSAALEENLREMKHEGLVVGSLRRDQDERLSMLESLGALHTRGAVVQWKGIYGAKGRAVQLPVYPWQRQRYWIQEQPPQRERPARAEPERPAVRGPFCAPEWRRAEPSTAPPVETAGAWLVLSDGSGTGDALAGMLRAAGATCVRALAGRKTRYIEPDLWEIDPTDPAAYKALIHSVYDRELPFRGVVHLFGLDGAEAASEDFELAQRLGSESALLLVQALLRAEAAAPPRVWLVTRGAAAVPGAPPVSLAHAPLWGLGRTLQAELGELAAVLVDLDPTSRLGEASALFSELSRTDREGEVALRGEARFVARLAWSGVTATGPAAPFRADGTYLITGGLGGLGLSFAEWMTGRGARHLVLVGRSDPSPAARSAIARMEGLGARVLVLSADISVRGEVDALVARIAEELPPLRGVVHSAAVLDDHTILKLSVDSMREVAAAKMYGAWHLHQATRAHPIELFVLFSSAASLLGSMGQGNYAAANAFVDALAHHRRAAGLPALAINWGPFAEVGQAAAQANRIERLSAMGFRSFTPARGHEALHLLLGGAPPQVGVLDLDVERACQTMPRLATAPRYAPFARPADRAPAQRAPAAERPLDAVLRAAPGQRRPVLERLVRTELAQVLRLAPDSIDRTDAFARHGFDSLMGLELRNRLQAGLSMQLSMADIVTHAQVDALAEMLERRLLEQRLLERGAGPASAPQAPASRVRRAGGWIVTPRPAASARVRLFCFPYAGGAAPVFNAWPEHLPPEIEVCAIQPPGRHERLDEPLLGTIEEMVQGLVPALLPLMDRPFAMFGHCLGAILMFEVARVLSAEHGKNPLAVFASGAPAPHRYLVPAVSTLSGEELASVLRSIGFADEAMLADRDVQESMMPAVKADFDVAARYTFEPGPKLEAPVMAFAGLSDPFAPGDLVDEWRRETTSRFSRVSFPGGHYFIVPERAELLAHVREEVLQRLAAEDQRAAPASSGAPWLVRSSPRNGTEGRVVPQARVVLFPGVGQGRAEHELWAAALGDDVEVCLVEAPGRGGRASELPLGRVDELAPHVARALSDLADLPLVFLGTDLGALAAFEVARLLAREGRSLPAHLIAVSAMAPDLHYFAPIHHLAPERLAAELRKFGIEAGAVAERALRADCAALSSYQPASGPLLALPITAFAGELDLFIPLAGVRGWRSCTSGPFTLDTSRRGHALRDRDRAKIAEAVRQLAREVVSRP